jgi:hypothetical protein
LPLPSRRSPPRVLLTIAALLLPSLASAQQPGAIEGSVTARDSGRPLAGVRVQVMGSARVAETDARGSYRLAGLPAGRYTLQATRLGRAPQQLEVTVAAGAATRAT